MFDYPSLLALSTIIREGNFERAAEALKITTSAVSQRIKNLEDRVGATLIIRGQPCRATEVGQKLCAHLDRVHMMESEVSSKLSPDMDSATPPIQLRVAVNSDSVATWFLQAAADFSNKTCGTIEIITDHEQHNSERLVSGDVLAAVTAGRRQIAGYRSTRLGNLRFQVTASPAFAHKWFPKGVNPEQFAQAPYIQFAQAPYIQFDRTDRLQRLWARQLRISLKGSNFLVPSTEGGVNGALHGVGWAINPEILVQPRIADGSLVDLFPGRYLYEPLFWQTARIGEFVLDELTSSVVAVAKQYLVPNA